MEHDRKCELRSVTKSLLARGLIYEGEMQTLRDHMLCFCQHRKGGGEVSLEMSVRLGERMVLVAQNHRNFVVQEERALSQIQRGDRVDGREATVTDLAAFKRAKNARSRDSSSE